MERFAGWLRTHIGLDAHALGAAGLEQALRTRQQACRLNDRDQYWQHLRQSDIEQQQLIEAVVVPETWFFRDPEALAALALLARRRELSHGRSRPLRLLSLPCSSGEEPYSMAMALLDAGLAPQQFHIDAIDISARSLARAEAALYGPNSFRGRALDFRERHFDALPGRRFRLHDAVRAQVTLRQGNLFGSLLAGTQQPYDFIFCRNVLIYFDVARQDEAAARLDALLAEDGALFVGPSETAVLLRRGLGSLGLPLAFAFGRRPAASVPAAASMVTTASATWTTAAATAPAVGRRRAQPDPIAQQSTPPAAALERAQQLADQGRTAAAGALCETHLQAYPEHAEAWYLLGLIRDAEGQGEVATRLLRKALYLDPEHAAAMAHLAALLDLQGQRAAAQVMRSRAQRVLEKHAK